MVVVAFGSATSVRRGAGFAPWSSPSSSLDPRHLALGGLLDRREQHLTWCRREHDDHAEGVVGRGPSRRSTTPCARPRRRRRSSPPSPAPRRPTRPRAAARRGPVVGGALVGDVRRSASRSRPPPPRPARARRGPTPARRAPPAAATVRASSSDRVGGACGGGRSRAVRPGSRRYGGAMDHVRWTTRPTLQTPVVIAAFEGWNDAGDAATHRGPLPRRPLGRRAGRRRRPRGVLRLHLHPARGATRRRRAPRDRVAGHRDLRRPRSRRRSRTCCVIIGTEPQLRWRTYCAELTEVAQRHGARLCLTLGALLAEVPHTRPTPIVGTAYEPDVVAGPRAAAVALRGPHRHRRRAPRRLAPGRAPLGVALGHGPRLRPRRAVAEGRPRARSSAPRRCSRRGSPPPTSRSRPRPTSAR